MGLKLFMKEIQLSMGKVALIDDEDFELVCQYNWSILSGSKMGKDKFYAKAHIKKQKPYRKILMHRLIMGLCFGHNLTVDHIDGDGLNNRRSNLRVCTMNENSKNRPIPKANSSGFKGVSWDKSRDMWESYIKVEYKKIHLGRYKDILQAASAYNDAAIKYFGEFARLNII